MQVIKKIIILKGKKKKFKRVGTPLSGIYQNSK